MESVVGAYVARVNSDIVRRPHIGWRGKRSILMRESVAGAYVACVNNDIVRSHIDWKGEKSIPYKGVDGRSICRLCQQ